MLDGSRTVRVSGLPAHADAERLHDKILIHFLRARNGGGEVERVTVVTATPVWALVTFEDRRVAQRVTQHRLHHLEVGGQTYELTVTEHRQNMDPDKVIVCLSAAVDSSHLPGGGEALTRLHQSHPDVQIVYDAAEGLHSLHGAFSKVQAALAQLLPGGPPWAPSSRKPEEQREEPLPVSCEEDLCLMVDADMFQYLQKHSREELQLILSRTGVDLVDVTNQGLTTLFLQDAEGGGGHPGRLGEAKKAISRFYQENETRICRSQLPKSILSPEGGLREAMEDLSVRFPKLLLHEDQQNVYLIGSSSDVSEAKRFLLLGLREGGAAAVGPPSAGHRAPAGAVSSPEDPVDDGGDPLLRSEEDVESRCGGSRRFKLAPHFKLSPPPDFTFRGLPSSSRQTPPRLGPLRGHDVLSDTPGGSTAQSTGGDFLFQGGDVSPSPAPVPIKTSTSGLSEGRPRSSTPALGPARPPPAASGAPPTLKRASSFSGMPQPKAQIANQKSQEASSGRGRSSSFSSQTEGKPGLCGAELRVPPVLWRHIRKAFSSRVGELTGDVKVKEVCSDGGGGDLSLLISGLRPSTVTSCQRGLQKLIDSVAADFSVQELRLSTLGVTAADDTLQACCAEVRSRFKKVTIQVLNSSLFILGPQRLCSQVSATLQEVFSDSKQTPQQQEAFFFPPPAPARNPSTFSQTHGEQGDPQATLHSQGRERRAPPRGGHSEAEPVVMETPRGEEADGQTEASVLPPKTGSVRQNGVGRAEKELERKRRGVTPPEEPAGGGICVCGESEKVMTRTKCGVSMCRRCLDSLHAHCRVCSEGGGAGVRGHMSSSRLPISVLGHHKDATIKITYRIPDGIQGEGHPSPGEPFVGGVFEAFLPDCERARRLLPRLEEAFRRGLTFTVTDRGGGARVGWDSIPHKISLQGGRSGNGYPDSSYLSRLSHVLTSNGIEDSPAKP